MGDKLDLPRPLRKVLVTQSPDATRALGAMLGRALAISFADESLVIALNGELGAGKTTLVGGLLRALGVVGAVRSPTYTLIEPYEFTGELAGRRAYHMDLYRLANADDLEMLAPRDLLEPGAFVLVEWAERAGKALPLPDLTITLSYSRDSSSHSATTCNRTITIEAATHAGETLATSLN